MSDDEEDGAAFNGWNEIDLDDYGDGNDTQIGGTTTASDMGSDDVDDSYFGFDDI